MKTKKRGEQDLLFGNTRGQAAIFVIASLLIVLSGLLYFYYQRQSVEREVELVKPEMAPVKLYIDNCIQTAAEDGLEKIGIGGGYISVPENIANDQRAYLTAFPASGFKIPYWWHDGIEAIPDENFIKSQLVSHIKAEFKRCANNFEPFKKIFEFNALKEPVIEVAFNDNDVSVDLKYPVEIVAKDGDFKGLMDHFKSTVPIRFRKAYELAKLIMERENKDYFLEKKTIDLYSMDRDIPTTDAEASCKTKSWTTSSVKEKMQTLLRVNLPYIRIIGTDYNPNSYVPNPKGQNVYSATYFQQHYLWEIDQDAKDKYKNMKVSFAYENWPMQFYARPNENGILKSNAQKGTDVLSFFCLQVWHFTYDLSYPVLATIIDQKTDKSKQYVFSFPFKVLVDHNQPKRDYSGTALLDTEPDLSSEDFCNNVQNEVTIFTVDNATGDGIRDVNLTFVCGRYYCDMDASNWIGLGGSAGITARLPFCVNGIIKGAKQGFSESKSFVQTNVDGRSYVLGLNPMKEFINFKVVKHQFSNPNLVSELDKNEQATIYVKSKDSNFETYAAYPQPSLSMSIPAEKDAEYEVNIYLANDEKITGGYIGDWKVSRGALKGANEIVFHAIALEQASDDETSLFVAGLGPYSAKVPAPELK